MRLSLILSLLLLLLLLRKARGRRREAPEAVSHGRRLRWLLRRRRVRAGSSSSGVELVRVGRRLLLLRTHFDASDSASVAGRHGRRRQRRDHPPVQPGVQEGQRHEDRGLEPREGDDRPSRPALGEPFGFFFFFFESEKSEFCFLLASRFLSSSLFPLPEQLFQLQLPTLSRWPWTRRTRRPPQQPPTIRQAQPKATPPATDRLSRRRTAPATARTTRRSRPLPRCRRRSSSRSAS